MIQDEFTGLFYDPSAITNNLNNSKFDIIIVPSIKLEVDGIYRKQVLFLKFHFYNKYIHAVRIILLF